MMKSNNNNNNNNRVINLTLSTNDGPFLIFFPTYERRMEYVKTHCEIMDNIRGIGMLEDHGLGLCNRRMKKKTARALEIYATLREAFGDDKISGALHTTMGHLQLRPH